MSSHLSKEECRKRFDMFDSNADERMSFKELERLLQYFGYNPTQEQVRDCMFNMGKTEKGVVDFTEFYDYFRTLPDPFKELEEAFKFFDKDGNGYLDKKEFRKILSSGMDSEKEIDDLFKLVDMNNDGKIQYEEFVELFSQMNC